MATPLSATATRPIPKRRSSHTKLPRGVATPAHGAGRHLDRPRLVGPEEPLEWSAAPRQIDDTQQAATAAGDALDALNDDATFSGVEKQQIRTLWEQIHASAVSKERGLNWSVPLFGTLRGTLGAPPLAETCCAVTESSVPVTFDSTSTLVEHPHGRFHFDRTRNTASFAGFSFFFLPRQKEAKTSPTDENRLLGSASAERILRAK